MAKLNDFAKRRKLDVDKCRFEILRYVSNVRVLPDLLRNFQRQQSGGPINLSVGIFPIRISVPNVGVTIAGIEKRSTAKNGSL